MRLRWLPRNRGFGLLDALGVTGAVGLLAARFLPLASLPYWRCEVRRLTGWPCPGCGLTRAADRLSHGNLIGAAAANPVGALAGILLALCGIYALLHLLFRLPTPELQLESREARRLRVMLAVLLMLNYAFVVVQTRFPALLRG